jgi:branched-subunit amino acid aminotransferase/4-amino-4-deoxychorismate lyase
VILNDLPELLQRNEIQEDTYIRIVAFPSERRMASQDQEVPNLLVDSAPYPSYLDIPVVERPVARTELYLADEAFLCGTAAEVQPLASIDRFTLGSGTMGPITRRLRDAYRQMVRGTTVPGLAALVS